MKLTPRFLCLCAAPALACARPKAEALLASPKGRYCLSVSLSVSVLSAIFPGESGLAGFIEVTEVVVTTGAVSHAKLQSDCHHQQTNAGLFTGRMPFLSPYQQCQSTNSSWLPWERVAMALISPLTPVPQLTSQVCRVKFQWLNCRAALCLLL